MLSGFINALANLLFIPHIQNQRQCLSAGFVYLLGHGMNGAG
jgi:hypothetical protein